MSKPFQKFTPNGTHSLLFDVLMIFLLVDLQSMHAIRERSTTARTTFIAIASVALSSLDALYNCNRFTATVRLH
jgi:hypothetical protein